MQLTGPQLGQLSEALRTAFTLQTFERMLRFRLGIELYNYAGPGNFQQVMFELLDNLNREETVDLLVLRAREAVPRSSRVLAFAQQLGLASTTASRQELERIIKESNSFIDPTIFRERLGEAEPRVCRMEISTNQGTVFGTGFLLGPSVAMTNYHVIDAVIEGEQGGSTSEGLTAKKGNVRVRFDYKRVLEPGGQVMRESQGRTYQLADDWLIDASPNSPLDELPREDHLDYALLRLDGAPGDEPIGGAFEPDAVKRGFIPLPANEHTFAADSSLFILQHPRGSPLKLALETKSVLGINENRTRVRYTTNTEPGSSGSPCFTPNWELVALHHSGDPDFDPAHKPTYNEGIPMSTILALVRKRGHEGKLGAQD